MNAQQQYEQAVQADREQVEREFDCSHVGTMEVRRRTIGNGTLTLWRQCSQCGKAPNAVKKAGYTDEEVAALPEFDEDLGRRHWSARSERIRALTERRQAEYQARADAEWWAWYDNYLRSPEWREKRKRVLRRANGECEGCGDNYAVQVHHLTYEHVGDEFLWELRAVCPACHERVHANTHTRRG